MSVSGGGLGPLRSGSRVAIIGGGPAGSSCAITLLNLAQAAGITLDVFIYEGKEFSGEMHQNQCVGVLSPPLEDVLRDGLGVAFPVHLVERRVTRYVLHTDTQALPLDGEGDPAYTVSRVRFDDYLLWQARARGAKVVRSRVTDLEFFWDQVMVYSESESRSVDLVVAAFGLDEGSGELLTRATRIRGQDAYHAPPAVHSIVAHVAATEEDLAGFGNSIHAFLPSERAIEFGGVTPKKDHFTVNIAGQAVTAHDMDEFLRQPQVISALPAGYDPEADPPSYFKGHFPVSIAKGICHGRYVAVGDASGLLRSFKGKGVTYACITGMRAARALMEKGIGRQSLVTGYLGACREIVDDIPYGQVVRWLAVQGAAYGLLDPILNLARNDAALRCALFDAVSANRFYREIVASVATPARLMRMGAVSALALVGVGR